MLSCKNLTVQPASSPRPILDSATVQFKTGAMNAVIGPSGCGKTTLVKAMLGIIPSAGESFFDNRLIDSPDELVGKVGFAPQFTCVHPMLTVTEAIEGALEIAGCASGDFFIRRSEILKIVGLEEHADKPVGALSGGQLRRIGLGVELAGDPPVLCCDEVTSGLDPLSENAILDLLENLCRARKKTCVCIIHNLAKLDYFDTVTVIHCGRVVFCGSPADMLAHFGIDSALRLYDRLGEFGIEHWLGLYEERKASEEAANSNGAEEAGGLSAESRAGGENKKISEAGAGGRKPPSFFGQFAMLLRRRATLFFRDTQNLVLTLAITFGFPIIVVIFSIGGLPQIESLALDRNLGVLDELRENLRIQISAAQTSTLVTGLILFQVVLLSLMGANNSAREIAAERPLYEKERLLGLHPSAYALSKLVFTSAVAVFQGLCMCVFVKYVCKFPGDFFVQSAVLAMACVATTAVCLAFSALFDSPEKANTVSIYLVGFQLPLSGIVLALPEALKWVCRPFISAYWGWAGYMSSMRETRIYDAYIQTRAAWEFLPDCAFALAVLSAQTLLAAAAVFYGCRLRKWK